MKIQQPQTSGIQLKQCKRGVYSNTSLPQEMRETSNKQPNFTPKVTRKRRTATKKKTPKLTPKVTRKRRTETKKKTPKLTEGKKS